MKNIKRELTVTYELSERIERPTVGRFEQTTHHRPRNTKGNRRREAALVLSTLKG